MFDCQTRTIITVSLVLVVLYAIFLLATPIGKATVLYIHRAYIHKDVKKPSMEVKIGMLILGVFFLGSGAVIGYSVSHSCK